MGTPFSTRLLFWFLQTLCWQVRSCTSVCATPIVVPTLFPFYIVQNLQLVQLGTIHGCWCDICKSLALCITVSLESSACSFQYHQTSCWSRLSRIEHLFLLVKFYHYQAISCSRLIVQSNCWPSPKVVIKYWLIFFFFARIEWDLLGFIWILKISDYLSVEAVLELVPLHSWNSTNQMKKYPWNFTGSLKFKNFTNFSYFAKLTGLTPILTEFPFILFMYRIPSWGLMSS